MRVGRRLFPYPVINNQKSLSGYKDLTFELVCNMSQTNDLFTLSDVHYNTDSETLLELLDKNLVSVVVIVECSSTVYRNQFLISDSPKTIKMPISDLRGKIDVSAYAYATQDINNYMSREFLDDYSEYSYHIDQYDMIAIDDGFSTRINYNESKDDKVASVFLILKDTTYHDELVRVVPADRKIKIYLRDHYYDLYYSMRTSPNTINIFFSILVIPALISSINLAKKDGLEVARENYQWFNSIVKSYNKTHDEELTEDELQNISSVELAQELMNFPIQKGIEDLFDIMVGRNEDDEDE